MELFDRKVAIEYGIEGSAGKRHDQLRVAFNVEHKLSKTPNKAKITVYNADEDTIALLLKPRAVVRLFAGYGANAGLIFQGNPIATKSNKHPVKGDRSAPDWKLEIEAMDGVRIYNTARVSVAYTGAVAWQRVLDDVLAATGLALGAPPPTLGASVVWPAGLTVEGPARDVLGRLAHLVRARWHIRDGVLIITDGGATTEAAPLLSTAQGNLLSFSQTESGYAVKCLLDPAMRSGRRVKIEGVRGRPDSVYVVRDLTFTGDSGWDTPFYCEMTCRDEADTLTSKSAPDNSTQSFGTDGWAVFNG